MIQRDTEVGNYLRLIPELIEGDGVSGSGEDVDISEYISDFRGGSSDPLLLGSEFLHFRFA